MSNTSSSGLPLQCIERLSVDASELMATTPPRWSSPNKAAIAAMTCPPGSMYRGVVQYSRWKLASLPTAAMSDFPLPHAEAIPGTMDYVAGQINTGGAIGVNGEVHWQVNFADSELFFGYSGNLMAQDEWQVVEHPSLGALRQRLLRDGCRTRMIEAGQATPALVRGVERRCEFAAIAGQVSGARSGAGSAVAAAESMYGGRFAGASVQRVRNAVRVIEPPTISNIIVIAAPTPGYGKYTPAQIETVVRIALTGFAAAVAESAPLEGTSLPVIVNTGFWGCGAFGGNRVLMAMLQLLAARAAGVGKVRFFVPERSQLVDFSKAQSVLAELTDRVPGTGIAAILEQIAAMGFVWGESDGN